MWRIRGQKTKRSPKAPAGRKTIEGSVSAIALGIVDKSDRKLGAGAVLAAVREMKPDVRSVGVYQALHTAAEDGKIGKEMVGNKAVYFKLGTKKK